MKKIALSTLLLASVALVDSAQAVVTTYDAADDFSILSGNPNGVWSYGSLATANSPFLTFTESLTIVGLSSWRRNEGNTGTPGFYFNPAPNTFIDGQTNLQSGELLCAPGSASLCTLRFTVPEDGRYNLTASFEGLISSASKPAGTTTDVVILKDGVALSPTLAIRGFRATSEKSFTNTLVLTQGTHLDFGVSGAFDGFASDSTGMEVRLELVPVPLPAALTLMLTGLGVVGYATRRHKLA